MSSFSSASRNQWSSRDIAYMAMYLALFTVLDFLANTVPIFKMPQGGSLGLGTIALLLCSYQMGWKKGLIVAALSIVMQFVTGQMYILGFVQFLLDYLIAFSVYGLACLFPTWKWFYSGVLFANVIRFFSSTLSGVWFYETTFTASMIYQAYYMVPTLILGLVAVPLLIRLIGPRYFPAVRS